MGAATAEQTHGFTSLEDFISWLERGSFAIGTREVASTLREILAQDERPPAPPKIEVSRTDPPADATLPWSVLIWTVPDHVRMSKAQVLEAMGRSPAWLYARTSANASDDDRIPHRKDASGELVFLAGEIRRWLTDRELVVHPGWMAERDLESQSGPTLTLER